MRRALAVVCTTAVLLGACTAQRRVSAPPDPRYASTAVTGCDHGPGRAGQDTALVPGRPTSVRICSLAAALANDQPRRTVTLLPTGPTLDGVLAVLRHGRLDPPVVTQCDAGGTALVLTLDFRYATGPEVSVDIGPDCHPALTNGVVATDNWAEVLPAIDAVIGVRCGGLVC